MMIYCQHHELFNPLPQKGEVGSQIYATYSEGNLIWMPVKGWYFGDATTF